MRARYNAVVIGAGHNGLVAVNYYPAPLRVESTEKP